MAISYSHCVKSDQIFPIFNNNNNNKLLFYKDSLFGIGDSNRYILSL